MRPLPTRKLDKRITRVWRLSAFLNVLMYAAITILPVFISAVAIAAEGDTSTDVAVGILYLVCYGLLATTVVLLIIFVIVMPKIRWIQWSFEVLDQEIDIHKGIFWKKRIIIPLIRVQNVDTRQGPVLRANGLASFTVATAAGEHVIPGLPIDEADALRDHVAMLAQIAQEDV